MININKLNYCWSGRFLFQDFSMNWSEGDHFAITGPSGVGKTTLLKLIAGLEPVGEGQIICQGSIAYLAQEDDLVPWCSVLHNALLGLRLQGGLLDHHHEQARFLLEHVGLGEYSQAMPHELSGGMRQRLRLVRTALQDRDIILLDEPLVGLDPVTKQDICGWIKTLFIKKTVLVVTHDQTEVKHLGYQVLHLDWVHT